MKRMCKIIYYIAYSLTYRKETEGEEFKEKKTKERTEKRYKERQTERNKQQKIHVNI